MTRNPVCLAVYIGNITKIWNRIQVSTIGPQLSFVPSNGRRYTFGTDVDSTLEANIVGKLPLLIDQAQSFELWNIDEFIKRQKLKGCLISHKKKMRRLQGANLKVVRV